MRVIIKTLDEIAAVPFSLLPKSLKEHISIKNNRQTFRQSHLAYCLLLETLKNDYGINNPEIKFSDSGKPFLENKPHFSISHSGELVALAVNDSEVGIDAEKIGEYRPAIADKYFSSSEKEYIDQGDKNINFFKLWTAKEALLKLQGAGLKELSDTQLIPISDGFRHKNIIIRTKVHKNYVISVCFNEKTGN